MSRVASTDPVLQLPLYVFATADEMLRAASGRTTTDPTSGYSLRVRLRCLAVLPGNEVPPMSEVRLFRRRNNRPCEA